MVNIPIVSIINIVISIIPGGILLMMAFFTKEQIGYGDAEAIHIAYGIYEKTLNGNYSISDIRNAIIEERQKKMAEKPVDEIIAPIAQPLPKQEEPKQIEQAPSFYDKLRIYLRERLDIKLPVILLSYTISLQFIYYLLYHLIIIKVINQPHICSRLI